MQEVTEHKSSRLLLHHWLIASFASFHRCDRLNLGQILLFFLLIWMFTGRRGFLDKVRVFSVAFPSDVVFASLLVEVALHQYIKETACRRVVSHFQRDVHCPEEWMTRRILNIRETDKIDSNMSNDAFIIKCLTHWTSNLHQINWRKRSLREEATCINKLTACKPVKWPNKLNITVWLNIECHRWWLQLVDLAKGRRCFNNSTTFTKISNVMVPVLIQSGLSYPDFLRQNLAYNILQARYDRISHLNFLLLKLYNGPHLINVEWSMTSSPKFIINLKQPNVDVQVVSN